MASMHRLRPIALGVLLALAAGSRFVGLTHHLERGAPDFDERNNFVDPVLRMWRKPTPDPTVYAGYPGFFNYLAFLPIGVGHRLGGHVWAYASARGLVAAFSVANVSLAYALGGRVLGAPYGLFAGALLLVSRIDVRSAQHITPDTLVATGVLAALLIVARRPEPARGALWLGAVAGAATAVKYTGMLAGVPGLVGIALGQRILARASRFALASALTFAALAPYALLQASDQGMGLAEGLKTYYGRDVGENRFVRGEGSAIGDALGLLLMTAGPVACALALLSLASRGPARDVIGPAAAVVIASFAIMAPANLVYPRHVLPAATVLPFLAAAGLRLVRERLAPRVRPLVVTGLVLAALWIPAGRAWPVVAGALRPAAVDLAAEWVEAHLPSPARLATSLGRFQLDEDRYEVRYAESLGAVAPNALGQYDAVVARTRGEVEALAAYETLVQFPSEHGDPGRPITVLRPPHPRLSAAPDAIAWRPAAPPLVLPDGPGAIELRWAEPIRPARVEVEVGPETQWPQPLELMGSRDGVGWQRLHAEALRPTRPHRQRRGAPHGQALVPYEERELLFLQVRRPEGGEWRATAVRVFVRAPPAP
jgi:hypothetical protein